MHLNEWTLAASTAFFLAAGLMQMINHSFTPASVGSPSPAATSLASPWMNLHPRILFSLAFLTVAAFTAALAIDQSSMQIFVTKRRPAIADFRTKMLAV